MAFYAGTAIGAAAGWFAGARLVKGTPGTRWDETDPARVTGGVIGAAVGGLAGYLAEAWLKRRPRPVPEPVPAPPVEPPRELQAPLVLPPDLPSDVVFALQADQPLPGCPIASRTYYGVLDWRPTARTGYPDWIILARVRGHQLTQQSFPILDVYYRSAYDCTYPHGVWGHGMNCDGRWTDMYQVARGSIECAAGPRPWQEATR